MSYCTGTRIGTYIKNFLVNLATKLLTHSVVCTLWIRRMGHRKQNRGRNRLPKLVQTTAPSVPHPVFHPPYPQGTALQGAQLGCSLGVVDKETKVVFQ